MSQISFYYDHFDIVSNGIKTNKIQNWNVNLEVVQIDYNIHKIKYIRSLFRESFKKFY